MVPIQDAEEEENNEFCVCPAVDTRRRVEYWNILCGVEETGRNSGERYESRQSDTGEPQKSSLQTDSPLTETTIKYKED
ncbi:hypothetical protein AAFF_G00387250 [Aldrovandia affinis]|uniref:Uncharacterized protein n=1 Tax=Aldrovandia affinis TaxID=143900 RepID=A0AAD7WLH1_9TELE|nr:hypothetical protein AAFF_G00387250 [Aldrovandia affinis]